jgi:TatD DNase family protein
MVHGQSMQAHHFFDAHCHLQDSRISSDLDALLERASRVGVRGYLCCSVQEGDWVAVEQLAQSNPCVVPAFGVHPWHAHTTAPGWLERLEQHCAKGWCGVGEIGLDFALPGHERDLQIAIFSQQLQLANRYRRPVSMHCREGWNALLQVLSEQGGVAGGGAVHAYSGSAQMAKQLQQLGVSISFGASLTRAGNRRSVAALQVVEERHLLLETDSPDMVPQGVVAPLNEPANITLVAAAMARMVNKPIEAIAATTFSNGQRIFCESKS